MGFEIGQVVERSRLPGWPSNGPAQKQCESSLGNDVLGAPSFSLTTFVGRLN